MAVTAIDERTALVVIDLQHGIVGVPTAPHPAADVVARTARLAEAFRSRGLPVVLVRVTAAPDWSDFAPGRRQTARPGRDRPDGWDRVVDELAGHPGDVLVTKRNPGAFYGTDLDLHLRRRGVTQIVLTGIATSVGVEATARAAYDHGYHVTVVSDATTDTDAGLHEHSMTRTFPGVGETGTTDDVLGLLSTTHPVGVRPRARS